MARGSISGHLKVVCCEAICAFQQPAFAGLRNPHLSAARLGILAAAQLNAVQRRHLGIMPLHRLLGLGQPAAPRPVSEAAHHDHHRSCSRASCSATPPSFLLGSHGQRAQQGAAGWPGAQSPRAYTTGPASRSARAILAQQQQQQLAASAAAAAATGVAGLAASPVSPACSSEDCLVGGLPTAAAASPPPAGGGGPSTRSWSAGVDQPPAAGAAGAARPLLLASGGLWPAAAATAPPPVGALHGPPSPPPAAPGCCSADATSSGTTATTTADPATAAATPPQPQLSLASPLAAAAAATSPLAAAAAGGSTTPTPTFTPSRSYSQHIKSDRALLAALTQPPAAYARGMGSVLDSIIKIYTVHSRPNYTLPWQNHPKRESTGTGFVVHDRLILTNAHVVADATYVLVKRHGSGTKYRADVQAVGHDCDLALLSVDDESFWSSPTAMLPLELGSVPELQQGVVVVGYPTGGDNTSVTSGVVSRVEVAQYAHAASHLMACQIDAAINPGNSGGPALQGDQVVGVAFQNLPGAENIGYIIPTPVVCHFLAEVRKYGSYQGYCSLGVLCQNLENPHLRAALGMSEGMTGVLVNTIQKTSNAAKVLKPGDVLLEFDGVKIANDGTVHLRQRERIYFSYLITLKPTGATAKVKVLRDGQVLSYDLAVTPNDLLVPVHCYDRLPSYFMFAGLVFVPLTQPYLHEYGEDWMNTAPRRLYDKAMHGMMQKPRQQIVILSQVLVDDVNTGYQQFQSLQVLRVNGTEVLNLAHLKQLVEGQGQTEGGQEGQEEGQQGERFVRFELEDERIMVVDRSLALDANRRIMERYRVPSSVSADIET